MTTTNLGLPIEYQQMPEFFDAHNINETTESKNALIEKLLKVQNVKTVLDMTCGTGSQVFYLAERGYEVVGSDFSPALLEIARKKAGKQKIPFIDGDMRESEIGKFDAVITIASAIGHLTKVDFAKTLKNISDNLKPNGIYIFDIFNLQALTDEVIAGFVMNIDKMVNGVRIVNSQHSEINRDKGLLISHDKYTIFKDGSAPQEYENTFRLQIYTYDELQKILAANGFEVISRYDVEGNDFDADRSVTMLIVGRKIK